MSTISRFDADILSGSSSFRGRVGPVFSHAAIVVGPVGWPLVTLLHPDRALVPLGIAIPWNIAGDLAQAAMTIDLRTLRIEPVGAPMIEWILVGDGVSLRVDGVTFRSLDLTRAWAQLMSLSLPARTLAILGRTVKHADGTKIQACAPFKAGLASAQICDDLQDPALPLLSDALHQLILDLRASPLDPVRLAKAVSALIGLGPGMTPSGDDIIAGVVAAVYRLTSARLMSADCLSCLREVLGTIPAGATTTTSVEMLRHAGAGTFVEPLCRLMDGLGKEGIDLQLIAVYLSRCGAQSGCDMMAGAMAVFEGI